MKRNSLHIVCSAFLLLNLFFTQVAANFLHDHHDHTESACATDSGTDFFQEDHPSCKICSLDLFHELFFMETNVVNLSISFEEFYPDSSYHFHFSFSNTATGRAPPLS